MEGKLDAFQEQGIHRFYFFLVGTLFTVLTGVSSVPGLATRNLFSLVVEAMIGTSFATPFLCCRKYANLSIQ